MTKARGTMKRFLIGAALLLTSIIIAFCIKGTVYSMDKGERGHRAMEEYCRSVEKEYVVNVKKILRANGYENAGVMLTKVFNDDGSRKYTLSINHKRLGKSEERADELKKEILELELPVEGSSISVMTTS